MKWNAHSYIKVAVDRELGWGVVHDAVQNVVALGDGTLAPWEDTDKPIWAAWLQNGDVVIQIIHPDADERFIADVVQPTLEKLNKIAVAPFEAKVHNYINGWNNDVVYKANGGPGKALTVDMPFMLAEDELRERLANELAEELEERAAAPRG